MMTNEEQLARLEQMHKSELSNKDKQIARLNTLLEIHKHMLDPGHGLEKVLEYVENN